MTILSRRLTSARIATGFVRVCYRLTAIDRALDQLLNTLTPKRLETLTPEQTKWLLARLQELHRLLAEFSRSSEAESIARLPIVSGYVSNLQNKTEDLDDIIEDLVLVNNEDFKNLISDCASSIGLSPGDTDARMQN